MKMFDYENNIVYNVSQKKAFEFNNGSWIEYYADLKKGSFEDIEFEYKDIDRHIIGITDDGEIIRLKNGDLYQVCWRSDECHIWKVDNDEIYELFDTKI